MKSLQYLKNVSTLSLDKTKCNGCRSCLDVCPHGVFSFENKKAVIVHKDACMECGACQQNCEAGALSVQTGVGCASAIINNVFSKSGGCCNC